MVVVVPKVCHQKYAKENYAIVSGHGCEVVIVMNRISYNIMNG